MAGVAVNVQLLSYFVTTVSHVLVGFPYQGFSNQGATPRRVQMKVNDCWQLYMDVER